jgi:hypothetical protein
LGFLATTAPVAYAVKDWSGEGHDVGLYQAYALGRVDLAQARPHPSRSWIGPMASVSPPASNIAVLPAGIVEQGLAPTPRWDHIYAGAMRRPGAWVLGRPPTWSPVRRGFFLGDGTAAAGRQIVGVIATTPRGGSGRVVLAERRALEDAGAIGTPFGVIGIPAKCLEAGRRHPPDRGILTTYATLSAGSEIAVCLDQIVWRRRTRCSS